MTSTHPRDDLFPAASQAWRVAALLVLVSVVATFDRGVLSIVVDAVRHDLRISDVQISLLQGFSFSLFYASLGLMLGLWADRLRRVRLLMCGVAVWCVATVAAGFAHGFATMFVCRVLVGLGEGTMGPCAVSLICDLFAPKDRGRPLGLYLMGQAVSSGLSVLLTGALLRYMPHGLTVALPWGSGALVLAPWRVAFILIGLVGMIVVPMLLATPEPARREAALAGAHTSLGARLRLLARRWHVLVPLYLGLAFVSAGFYGALAWGIVSLTRHYGIAVVQVTGRYGPAAMLFGAAAPLIVGALVDRIMGRYGAQSRMRMLAVIPVLFVPAILGGWMPAPLGAIWCLATVMGAYPSLTTVFYTVLQGLVPNELRGFSVSLSGLTNAIVGATGGPLLIAALAHHAFNGPAATARALSTCLALGAACAAACFAVATRGAVRSAPDRVANGAGALLPTAPRG